MPIPRYMSGLVTLSLKNWSSSVDAIGVLT